MLGHYRVHCPRIAQSHSRAPTNAGRMTNAIGHGRSEVELFVSDSIVGSSLQGSRLALFDNSTLAHNLRSGQIAIRGLVILAQPRDMAEHVADRDDAGRFAVIDYR